LPSELHFSLLGCSPMIAYITSCGTIQNKSHRAGDDQGQDTEGRFEVSEQPRLDDVGSTVHTSRIFAGTILRNHKRVLWMSGTESGFRYSAILVELGLWPSESGYRTAILSSAS
jgi:hypothetical protein